MNSPCHEPDPVEDELQVWPVRGLVRVRVRPHPLQRVTVHRGTAVDMPVEHGGERQQQRRVVSWMAFDVRLDHSQGLAVLELECVGNRQASEERVVLRPDGEGLTQQRDGLRRAGP